MALDVTGRAVLLDMDGTLVDSDGVINALWAQFVARYGGDLDHVLTWTRGKPTHVSVPHFLPDGHDPAAVIREMDDAELTRTVGIRPMPGAVEVVAALAGIPHAVVTSASTDLASTRLAAAGLPIEVIVGADSVDGAKPDPAPYLAGAALLAVDPADCIVLEDAEAGLLSGLAAGCQVIVVGDHESATTASLPRARSLAEVVVEHLEDGRVRLVDRHG